MSKRIKKLSESPCYQCGMCEQCEKKVSRKADFQTIVDRVFADSEFDYHDCSLWIAMSIDKKMKWGEI